MTDFCRIIIRIGGLVQGVGFRPFVYNLAQKNGLFGRINNSNQGVIIELEGIRDILLKFVAELKIKKPTLAEITSLTTEFLDPFGFTDLRIIASENSGKTTSLILPDLATCSDCLREVMDPTDRRYFYPFTNCTNCGPRYSIIEKLPYDRKNTTMKKFNMCQACLQEYNDPADRRFHAQPNACPDCGPRLTLVNRQGRVLATERDALEMTVKELIAGKIVALKGIGGFQLLCLADEQSVISRLRQRKKREEKPFALMFPDLASVKKYCEVSPAEEFLLTGYQAPIVLLRQKETPFSLPWEINCSINPFLGVMLPYSPLHHLLLVELGVPLIATSGNISGDPLCIENSEALMSLNQIADLFLLHDRPILRPVDDSVIRVVLAKPLFIRRARGFAPLPLSIRTETPNILAVGGQLKNTISLAIGTNIFLSPHNGDLFSEKSFFHFGETIKTLTGIYQEEAKIIVCDLHPDYLSTSYAQATGKKLLAVQHHYAHILAVMAEYDLQDEVLGVAWDGTGLGTDQTIWGGEFLLISEKDFSHFARFNTFPLPGGERAAKNTYLSALGLLYSLFGREVLTDPFLSSLVRLPFAEKKILAEMLEKKIRTPLTSSIGRMFDAIAALAGVKSILSFEGQAAMETEFLALFSNTTEKYSFSISSTSSGPLIIDYQPLFLELLDDLKNGKEKSFLAKKFHNTLPEIILRLAIISDKKKVVLSGGCFQNKLLLESTINLLEANDFSVYWPQKIPVNDGGLSVGQIIAAGRIWKYS